MPDSSSFSRRIQNDKNAGGFHPPYRILGEKESGRKENIFTTTNDNIVS
jgi:hypothetical protein